MHGFAYGYQEREIALLAAISLGAGANERTAGAEAYPAPSGESGKSAQGEPGG